MGGEINTTIILTKNNMDHGIIGNCQECPLALAINRYHASFRYPRNTP